MAPSVAVGTTGLERVLLIFLVKNQQIKLQRTKPSPAKRSIQQSIGQKLSNCKELPRTQTQQQKPPQKLATLTRNYRFYSRTPDSPIRNTNER